MCMRVHTRMKTLTAAHSLKREKNLDRSKTIKGASKIWNNHYSKVAYHTRGLFW
jgi:hypothetical protein